MVIGIPLGLFVLFLAWSVSLAFGPDLWLWVTAWVFIGVGLLSVLMAWQRRERKGRIKFDPPPTPDNPYN